MSSGSDRSDTRLLARPAFDGRRFRESHIAFTAPDRAAVRAFFDAAVAPGAEVLHEPRVWPEYHPNYYGAFVRDPDGNNVEAVCHARITPPPACKTVGMLGAVGPTARGVERETSVGLSPVV